MRYSDISDTLVNSSRDVTYTRYNTHMHKHIY